MNEENKNYESVLLERLESKMDVLIEGQKVIGEKVAKIDLLIDDMDYVKSEIVEIKNRFKEVDAELDKKAQKEAVSDHETRILKLENAALAEA